MASVTLYPPLGAPLQYDPKFKVECCLHDPLWVSYLAQTNDIALQVAALAAQLEQLCRRELAHHSSGCIKNGKISNSLETKGMVAMEQIKALLAQLPFTVPNISDYFNQTGLSRLFPRATAFVTCPEQFSLSSSTTNMDGYFTQIATLHQITSLAVQIHNDVINLTNHKYLAHQVALLHSCLTSVGDCAALAEVKSNIEANFKTLKESVSGDITQPRLSTEQAQWMIDLMSSVTKTVAELPSALTQNMLEPAQTLSQIC